LCKALYLKLAIFIWLLFQAIGNEADITTKWTVAVAIFTEMNLSPQSFAAIKVSSSLPEKDNQPKMALRRVQHILMEDILPRLVMLIYTFSVCK